MRALITGIRGFAGSWLAEHLVAEGWEVEGVSRRSTATGEDLPPGVKIHAADLCDQEAAVEVLGRARPDVIFHLAAQSSVSESWRNPQATVVNNLTAQLNVLRVAADAEQPPRVVIASSAQVYGPARPEDMPLTESAELRPGDPYAFSKVAQEFLAVQYEVSHHLSVIRLRLFNHIGPRQGTAFVLAAFAEQIAEAEAGRREPVLMVGSLDNRRDFLDVRDVARAYRLAALMKDHAGVFNVASGRAVAVGDLLRRLVALSRVPIEVRQDPARVRISDVPILEGDPARFRAATGWEPAIDLEATLADTLDHWRERVGRLSRA